MGYRNPYGSQLFIQSSLLSQKVAEADPFFKEIALMGVNERVAYATLYTIIKNDILNKNLEKMNDKELIEEVVLPLIQRIGQAKFRADPLTHLGMKVGKSDLAIKWET